MAKIWTKYFLSEHTAMLGNKSQSCYYGSKLRKALQWTSAGLWEQNKTHITTFPWHLTSFWFMHFKHKPNVCQVINSTRSYKHINCHCMSLYVHHMIEAWCILLKSINDIYYIVLPQKEKSMLMKSPCCLHPSPFQFLYRSWHRHSTTQDDSSAVHLHSQQSITRTQQAHKLVK